jgi:hypothetical protein
MPGHASHAARILIIFAFASAAAACGEAESKPAQLPPNAATNNGNPTVPPFNSSSGNNPSPNGSTEECLLDVDCLAAEVCEAGVCVPSCQLDDDCAFGEACEVRLNGPGSICVPAPVNNVFPGECTAQPDPIAFCEAQFGEGSFCDTASGDCVTVEEPLAFVVQIQDITVTFDSCDAVPDPGSDIQGIELLSSVGESLGWGSIVAEGVLLDGNDEANFGILDGTPSDLDVDGCVDSFAGNVLSLGCTGWIAVEFIDASGNPVPLEQDQIILVYEYGDVCSDMADDDEYAVSICSDTAGIAGGDDSSCTNVLGTGFGVSSLDVLL